MNKWKISKKYLFGLVRVEMLVKECDYQNENLNQMYVTVLGTIVAVLVVRSERTAAVWLKGEGYL